MALVGSISGSGGVSNTIGITGSVIIANPGTAAFPGLPGSDVALFVSGNIAPKPATSPVASVRGTTVFGGDVVISGTLFGGSPLHIGTFISASQGAEIGGTVTFTSNTAPIFNNGLSGSLTKLADGTSYLIAGTNVTIVTGTNGAVTISSTAGGTGDVVGPASATDNAIARFDLTTGKLIQNSAVTISDESANAVTVAGSATATTINLFNTDATTLNFAGGATAGTNIGNASGLTTIAGGVKVSGNFISGSTSKNLTLGSNGDVTVEGDLAINGGDLTTSAATFNLVDSTATTVNFARGAASIVAGAAGSSTTFQGNVTGSNFLINGSSITLAGGSTSISHPGGGNLTISAAGSVSIEGSTFSGNNATIPGNLTVNGDLYISGTTTTIDSTVVEMQDPVIGFGFASGSNPVTAGDRGFIGGITGTGNNVAFVWSNNSGSFIATKTTTVPGVAPVVVSQLQPIRASKLEIGSTSAIVTSSQGTDLLVRGSSVVTISSTGDKVALNPAANQSIDFQIGASSHAELTGSAGAARFGAVGSRQLILSGAAVNLNAGASGISIQRDGIPIGILSGTTGVGGGLRIAAGDTAITSELTLTGSTVIIGSNGGTTTVRGGTIVGDRTTQNIFNTVAQTISFGGAATNIGIGVDGGQTVVSSSLTINGNTTFGNNISTDLVSFANAKVSTSILPNGDRALDLGSATERWANIYTGDLHLRNDRGDWTIIEERDFLTITNNHTGRRYKFMMEEI